MKLKIAVLPGDGIGPEIVGQALQITEAVCKRFGHELSHQHAWVGACAIDRCGNPYPEETHKLCMESDAVLFGAIGDPKYDNNPSAKVRPEQGLLGMRKQLGLYANIRPVTTFSSLLHKSPLRRDIVEGTDLMCIRELTGGIYFGRPQGRSEDGTVAYDTCVYSREEVERIVRLAYKYARQRRKKVTVVDKANVLCTSRLWREVSQEIAKENADVTTEYMFVDNAAMQLVRRPSQFDVVVTSNMFGDILSDEASQITGSIGMLPSASLGATKRGLYEPIHGSAPDIAGQNKANPIATILSAAMMLRYAFDMADEADCIERAVDAALNDGLRTADIVGQSDIQPLTCTEMTDAILARL